MLLVTVFTTQSLSIKYGRQASIVNDKVTTIDHKDQIKCQGFDNVYKRIVANISQRLYTV